MNIPASGRALVDGHDVDLFDARDSRCCAKSWAPLKTVLRCAVGASILLNLQACAVVAVADAAVTVVATGVKVTAKAVGAVADAVIPDGD